MRNVVWKLFEDPNSSKAARVCLLIQKIKVEEIEKKFLFCAGSGHSQLSLLSGINSHVDTLNGTGVSGKEKSY